jgi:hypothetical protein
LPDIRWQGRRSGGIKPQLHGTGYFIDVLSAWAGSSHKGKLEFFRIKSYMVCDGDHTVRRSVLHSNIDSYDTLKSYTSI